MKNQALFSSKDKSKKLKCCLLQFLFGTLKVKSKNISYFPLHFNNCYLCYLKLLVFQSKFAGTKKKYFKISFYSEISRVDCNDKI